MAEDALADRIARVNQKLWEWAKRHPTRVLNKQWAHDGTLMIGFKAGITIQAVDAEFGVDGWSYRVIEPAHNGCPPLVSVTIGVPPAVVERCQYGGDGLEPKAALTDAIAKALSMFGIAAAAYHGLIATLAGDITTAEIIDLDRSYDPAPPPEPEEAPAPRRDQAPSRGVGALVLGGQTRPDEPPHRDDPRPAAGDVPDESALRMSLYTTFTADANEYLDGYDGADIDVVRQSLRKILMAQWVLAHAPGATSTADAKLHPWATDQCGSNAAVDLKQFDVATLQDFCDRRMRGE